MEIPNQYVRNLYKVALVFLVIISLFFAVKLLTELKSYGMMGSSESNTITLSGHGEVTAVPDVANIYFTIRKDAKTTKEAQDKVAVTEKSALDFLKKNGVEDRDIQTSNAATYPKYEYITSKSSMPCSEFSCPPSVGKSVISGYEASESITVKVRKVDDAGKLMQGLGTVGVSDLSGPNFGIDNEDNLKAEARKKAIGDAREKAEALAKDLGVRLGRIATFSESGGYPMMYAVRGAKTESDAAAPAQLPKGENTISSDVTITYEIR